MTDDAAFPPTMRIFRRDRRMTMADHMLPDDADWQTYRRADLPAPDAMQSLHSVTMTATDGEFDQLFGLPAGKIAPAPAALADPRVVAAIERAFWLGRSCGGSKAEIDAALADATSPRAIANAEAWAAFDVMVEECVTKMEEIVVSRLEAAKGAGE
jgi:hypothetical protein